MFMTRILQLIKMGMEIIPYGSELNYDAPVGSALNTMLDEGLNVLDSMSQGDAYGSGCDY